MGNGSNGPLNNCIQPAAGTLPENAIDLTQAARGLLVRLLERDPRVRMRSLRQLQQSAFYMGFNLELVKMKKISPKSVLARHFPQNLPQATIGLPHAGEELFPEFSQPALV